MMNASSLQAVKADATLMVSSNDRPAQRLAQKYRFNDPDMDLFFMAALSWGPSGGLDIGQAYYIATQIADGDADSWIKSFGDYADTLNAQADAWAQRGWHREAGEVRLKAFASYRSAWQFAAPGGAQFQALYAKHKLAFATAMQELGMPSTFFAAPYNNKYLPGVLLRNAAKDAPVVLVIGGADTCFEDLFLTVGRNLFDRGYSVALVDLPGQGNTACDGLYWEAQAEQPVAAVVEVLKSQFDARPGRMALMGLSLGGYFVARAAGHLDCFATVIASTPFPNPAQMFALSVQSAMKEKTESTAATLRSRQTSVWKAGARTAQEFVERTAGMIADPALVTVPFLSILGGGDSGVFAMQAMAWHHDIQSQQKRFVLLDAASGADGHVQVNNRLRLAQESCGWMSEIFS
ncbi:MAG: alpha/beta fold hydrolase [Steroidobacteraceae bacterium]